MTPKTATPVAYAVDQFRDPNWEIARLQQQATVIAAAEDAAFRSLGFPETGCVLDLGCGPGFVAARMKASRPGLDIVGLDRDATVLRQARPLIQAVAAEAGCLPFLAHHFDCVYARLVLRHLTNPEATLREVRRVLRPGGRAIVLDTDDGALVLHPWPEAFGKALAARQQTFRRRGADPFIARRLPALLGAAALGDLAVRTVVVDSVSVGLRAFAHIVLSPIADAIDPDLLSPLEVDAARVAVGEWAAMDGAFGMTTAVVAGGTKGD